MSRTTPCKFAGTTTLLLLLATVLLFGCRSSEPPAETETIAQDTSRRTPDPPPPSLSEPVTIQPLVVMEAPDQQTSETTVQPPVLPALSNAGERQGIKKQNISRIAVIIDDLGQHQQLGRQFLQLDLNLTYSFLPDAPYTEELAETAFQAGRDILVHLPMEPKSAAWNPGFDALTVQDQPETIREKMARMLDAVPHATGANNHMGSRFTEDAAGMQVVIDTLKNRSFYFIDSSTTSASRGVATAQQGGVPTARRHVFLDTVREPQKICRQMEVLAALAKKQGWAIGIGHPNRAMLTALSQCSRERFNEVEMVGAHHLVQ